MPFLPVVGRELRSASRRRATHHIRFWMVSVGLIIFIWQLLVLSSRAPARQGEMMLAVLAFMTFLYCALIGALVTSDCISSEKRDGTLGLLFLTDLRGYDIILGKLTASSLNAFYGVIAVLPILGIPLLMGGVTMVQFLKLALALLTTCILSLSVGILVSTWSRHERKALFFSTLFAIGLAVGPFVLGIWATEVGRIIPERNVWAVLLFSPGFAIGMALDSPPPPGWPTSSYWYSIIWIWCLTLLFLALASWKVPRSWSDLPRTARKPKPSGKPRARISTARAQAYRRHLDVNPFLWLALRGEANPGLVWMFVLSMVGVWFVAWFSYPGLMVDPDLAVPFVLFVHGFVKLWIAAEGSRRFVEDRRNNVFEFLLATPLTDRQFIAGQWLALIKQFRGPILFLLAWETLLICLPRHGNDRDVARQLHVMIFLVADFIALGWVAMYFGLKSKTRAKAIIFTALLVLAIPSDLARACRWLNEFFDIFPGPTPSGISVRGNDVDSSILTIGWIMCGLLVNLALIYWARTRLHRNFRKLATA